MGEEIYDVIIIGGGAAGLTAGIYTCRAGLQTLMLERLMPGGQVINAERIENFPGFPDGISGAEIGPLMQQQAMNYGLEIRLGEVDALAQDGANWRASAWGEDYIGKAVIIAGGSTLRKLGVRGEEELYGAGVSYCATCDGGFFMNQTVGVVGGGDSALDEALVLTEYASKVILFHRGDGFRRREDTARARDVQYENRGAVEYRGERDSGRRAGRGRGCRGCDVGRDFAG